MYIYLGDSGIKKYTALSKMLGIVTDNINIYFQVETIKDSGKIANSANPQITHRKITDLVLKFPNEISFRYTTLIVPFIVVQAPIIK